MIINYDQYEKSRRGCMLSWTNGAYLSVSVVLIRVMASLWCLHVDYVMTNKGTYMFKHTELTISYNTRVTEREFLPVHNNDVGEKQCW